MRIILCDICGRKIENIRCSYSLSVITNSRYVPHIDGVPLDPFQIERNEICQACASKIGDYIKSLGVSLTSEHNGIT